MLKVIPKNESKILTENKIKRIFTIADVHIRNDYEYDSMYYKLFDTLFDELKKQKICDSDLIFLLGDILDKGDLISGNAMSLLGYLYKGLSSFCDTISIVGNHEDKNEKDTLTPFLQYCLGSKNKNYVLLDSGVFIYGDVCFCYTKHDSDKVISAKGYEKYTTISVYHGMLNGCKLENNMLSTRNKFSMQNFRFDYSMFGDCHSFQFTNKDETGFYTGSLTQIKQNDKIDHGFCVLDLSKKLIKFIPVNNVHKKLNLTIQDEDTIVEDILKYKNNTSSLDLQLTFLSPKGDIDKVNKIINKELKDVKLNKVLSKYIYQPIKYDEEITIDGKKMKFSDVNSKNDFVNYLCFYLKKNEHSDINGAKKMLLDLCDEVKFDDTFKSKRKIEFIEMRASDILCMKDVVIKFNKDNNVFGFCENNSSGKSTLCEMISLVLSGETPRCSDNGSFVKTGEKMGTCSLKLKVNGICYFVTRYFYKKGGNGKDETYVDFIKYAGNKETEYVAYTNNDDIKRENNKVKFIKMTLSDVEKIINNEILSYDEIYENIVVSQDRTNSFVSSRDKVESLLKMTQLSYVKELADIAKNRLGKKRTNFTTLLGNIDKIFLEGVDDMKKNGFDNSVILNKIKQNINQIKNKNDNDVKMFEEKLFDVDKEFNECIVECVKYEEQLKCYDEFKKIENVDVEELEKNIVILNKELKENDIKKIKLNISKKEKRIKLIDKLIREEYEDVDNINKQYEKDKKISIDAMKKQLFQLLSKIEEITENIIGKKEHDKLLKNVEDKQKIIIDMEKELVDLLTKQELFKKVDLFIEFNKFLNDKYRLLSRGEVLKYFDNIEKYSISKELKKFIVKEKKKIKKEITVIEKIKFSDSVVQFSENISDVKNISDNVRNLEKQIAELKGEIIDNNKKIKIFNVNKQNIKNRCEIKQIQQKIDKLEEECDEDYKKYLEYEEEKKNMEKNIAQLKVDLLKEENKILKIEKELEKKKDLFDKIKINEAKYEEYCIINEKYEDMCDDKSKKHKKYEKLKDDKAKLTYNLKEKNNQCITALVYVKDMEKIINDIYNLESIHKVIGVDGLSDRLLKMSVIPALQKAVSEICQYAGYDTINIDYVGGKHIKLSTKMCPNIANIGGFRKNASDLIFKLAFLKINGYLQTNIVCIDEGFDACSNENVPFVLKMIDLFRSQYDNVLVVSHNTNVISKFDLRLKIEKKANGNVVLAT